MEQSFPDVAFSELRDEGKTSQPDLNPGGCGLNLDAVNRIQAIQDEVTKLPESCLGQIEALLAKIETERETVRLPAHKLAGRMKGRLTPVDDFLREKHAAGDRW